MSTIFINYRRDDSGSDAMLLNHRLTGKIDGCDLFMDVKDIPAGRNFVRELQSRVATCDVLLAVMGPDWFDIRDDRGKRRLENPEDHVRVEIAAALARGIPVVPILIETTRMPRAEQLPADLGELPAQNARRLRIDTYDADFSTLLTELRRLVSEAQKAAWAKLARMPEQIGEVLKEWIWGSFAGLALGGILYLTLSELIKASSPSEAKLAAAMPLLLSAAILTILLNKKLFEWSMFRASAFVGYLSGGITGILHAWLTSIRAGGQLPADNSLPAFFFSLIVPLVFLAIRLRYRNGPSFWRDIFR